MLSTLYLPVPPIWLYGPFYILPQSEQYIAQCSIDCMQPLWNPRNSWELRTGGLCWKWGCINQLKAQQNSWLVLHWSPERLQNRSSIGDCEAPLAKLRVLIHHWASTKFKGGNQTGGDMKNVVASPVFSFIPLCCSLCGFFLFRRSVEVIDVHCSA